MYDIISLSKLKIVAEKMVVWGAQALLENVFVTINNIFFAIGVYKESIRSTTKRFTISELWSFKLVRYSQIFLQCIYH